MHRVRLSSWLHSCEMGVPHAICNFTRKWTSRSENTCCQGHNAAGGPFYLTRRVIHHSQAQVPRACARERNDLAAFHVVLFLISDRIYSYVCTRARAHECEREREREKSGVALCKLPEAFSRDARANFPLIKHSPGNFSWREIFLLPSTDDETALRCFSWQKLS